MYYGIQTQFKKPVFVIGGEIRLKDKDELNIERLHETSVAILFYREQLTEICANAQADLRLCCSRAIKSDFLTTY